MFNPKFSLARDRQNTSDALLVVQSRAKAWVKVRFQHLISFRLKFFGCLIRPLQFLREILDCWLSSLFELQIRLKYNGAQSQKNNSDWDCRNMSPEVAESKWGWGFLSSTWFFIPNGAAPDSFCAAIRTPELLKLAPGSFISLESGLLYFFLCVWNLTHSILTAKQLFFYFLPVSRSF